ncbi:reverse transcriptase domain-containing protein [Tanacetum coccineum]|uniref:Reverse transcriptase domain-containing protein n=1 Tax=Tanacetum coccineum TaxID=301880 RepID=A0ABQ5EXY3_9ASTR
MTQATIQADQITAENVQRRAPGNKGKQIATGSQGKLVTCYNCRGQGHIARECKEKKREKDSQWFKDKALLMEAKEKGTILDAEAEAFLADVECIAPYAEPLAITTTMAFEVSHEDAYDSDVDEAPHAAAAFMANLTGTSTGEGTSNDTDFHSEDLHKTTLGRSNPKYLKTAQLSRPALYHGDIVVNPLHTPHRVHDNEDTLVHAEVNRTKMLEKMKGPECPIISSPINYAKLNNLYDTFVPQKELTREHAYWLPANEVASNQSKPANCFVHTCPVGCQDNSHLKHKIRFPKFDEVIKIQNKTTCLTDGIGVSTYQKRYVGSISNLFTLKSLINEVMVMASSFESSEFWDSKEISLKKTLYEGLPKLKFTEKGYYVLHVNLGQEPMRVESINGIGVVFWLLLMKYTDSVGSGSLKTKDKTPEVIKKFIILTQRALNATVGYLRPDNGMEFVNKTLTEFCESVGITHNKRYWTHTERRVSGKTEPNSYGSCSYDAYLWQNVQCFLLWGVAVATACYTLNGSLVHTLHGKTYYELLKGKKPEVNYFRVFGIMLFYKNDC